MILNTLKRIFFPEVCKNCGDIIPIGHKACTSCGFRMLPRVSEDFCEHCGSESDNCCCGYRGSAYLSHITAPFFYSGEIKERLHNLKFHQKPEESEFLAHEMSLRFASVYPKVAPDYVCAVPLTAAKLQKRGYNQSELLARQVCDELLLDYAELILKVKDTLNQHNLSKQDRLNNLDSAFSVNEEFDLDGKTVLLCDDIKTTGTTLRECSNVLFNAGASDVYCLCAAVTDYFVPITWKLDKIR